MSLDWRPERPCREEVLMVIRYLRDALEAAEIIHATEQTAENPDVFAVMAYDHSRHVNRGFVGWAPELGRVFYAAVKEDVARRDALEGIPEDESRSMWTPTDADMMAMHLRGEVRDIEAHFRALMRAAVDEQEHREAA